MYWFGKSRNNTDGASITFTGIGVVESLYSLEWTTNVPQKSGIYFAVQKDKEFIDCVEVDVKDSCVFLHGYDMAYRISDFTHWLGPIPEPEKPEK